MLLLHSKPLLVTGALFLQQDMLVQSYFPGQVPRVSLLPPTSFLQFCGYLWVCTKGTLCSTAQQSLSLLWRVAERKDLKIIIIIIEFCLIPRICPSPWSCTGLAGADTSTGPSCSSDSQVWARHCRRQEAWRALANGHVLSIIAPSGRTSLPTCQVQGSIKLSCQGSCSPGPTQTGWPMASEPGRL